jgi:hypothetical protein
MGKAGENENIRQKQKKILNMRMTEYELYTVLNLELTLS